MFIVIMIFSHYHKIHLSSWIGILLYAVTGCLVYGFQMLSVTYLP